MKGLLFRIYVVVSGCIVAISAWGQDVDEGDVRRRRDDMTDMDGMDMMMDYTPVHISFSDIVVVLFLILACYVFGKIWKGCSYLIILIAVAFYFLLHS